MSGGDETPTGTPRRLVRALAVDVAPLRHRDFRLRFIARGVSLFGSMVTYVALPYQMYRLTGSSLQVGLIGLAEITPLVVTAVLGGALADANDRRRQVLACEVALMCCSAGLLVNASLGHPRAGVLYVLAACIAAFEGLQRPRSRRWCRASCRARSSRPRARSGRC